MMETVLLVIHTLIALALVGVVLLQRSEGGALGIGGGNSFMTGRAGANLLTKATTVLGAAFFGTSLGLGILAAHGREPAGSILDKPASSAPAVPGTVDQFPAPADAPATPAAPAGGAVPTQQ